MTLRREVSSARSCGGPAGRSSGWTRRGAGQLSIHGPMLQTYPGGRQVVMAAAAQPLPPPQPQLSPRLVSPPRARPAGSATSATGSAEPTAAPFAVVKRSPDPPKDDAGRHLLVPCVCPACALCA